MGGAVFLIAMVLFGIIWVRSNSNANGHAEASTDDDDFSHGNSFLGTGSSAFDEDSWPAFAELSPVDFPASPDYFTDPMYSYMPCNIYCDDSDFSSSFDDSWSSSSFGDD